MTESNQSPHVIVIMGVTGAGKSTIGSALANALDWQFIEGDEYHSAENVARMKRGLALGDTERAPWLASLRALIATAIGTDTHAVVACSALKAAYRSALVPPDAPPDSVRFVHLQADRSILQTRLERRTGHYAGVSLLSSQLATLEEPADALSIDASKPPEKIVAEIRAALRV
jgi:gluconokinase